MLKSTIPTLEIKTSGIDLSVTDSLYITIKKGEFQTVKSNDDIEVDNDIISVSLSHEEAERLKEAGGANIYIVSVLTGGEVLPVRIIWTKRGSRTSGSGNSGGTAESTVAWYPSVSGEGELTWSKKDTEVPPEPMNIMGPPGPMGEPGPQGPQGPPGESGEMVIKNVVGVSNESASVNESASKCYVKNGWCFLSLYFTAKASSSGWVKVAEMEGVKNQLTSDSLYQIIVSYDCTTWCVCRIKANSGEVVVMPKGGGDKLFIWAISFPCELASK